jgi:5-(carboxyamino)imidazole ribonucleotide mutase
METREPERGAVTSQVEPEELESMPEVEQAFEGIEVDAPRVGIIMGSESDKPAMEPAGKELKERGIRFEVRVLSAHRDPEAVADYARNAHMRGLRVIIAGAGMSAALPGVVAAHTDLPVIGVPLKAKNTVGDGLDALLSTVQMPPGVPVACVAVNGARNAAVLAGRILGCL